MKRSCTIVVFAVLMLCIFSSPYAAETTNPDSMPVDPIYQLASVSTSPALPTVAQNEYIVSPSILPPSSSINQKESRTLFAGIFDKLINKDGGHNNNVPTPECQEAIKQLGSFLSLWQKVPRRTENQFCWMMTEDCFYPRKKFSLDLFSNVATACGIGKGFAWKGKTHNLRCSDQLQSFKGSVDKLIAATAVTLHYPPSHPIWAETEENCRNYGLCEFQLESTRYPVLKSYSKIKAACNMN